ncbi:MAG TPA: EamA family transporter [Candidatus Nanoarchaeia archaeon]|nr:EamA family transporter [Candidatus Nanoarchaeia archaeon]
MTELWAVVLVLISGVYGGLAPIYLKRGVESFQIKKFRTYFNLLKGFFIYVTGALIFIFALKGGELSVLYPLVAFSYVWTCLYSKLMLKEQMNKYKWLGILLVVFGVMLISLGTV